MNAIVGVENYQEKNLEKFSQDHTNEIFFFWGVWDLKWSHSNGKTMEILLETLKLLT